MENKEFIEMFLKRTKMIEKENIEYIRAVHKKIENFLSDEGIEFLIKKFYSVNYDITQMKESILNIQLELKLNEYTINYFIYLYSFKYLQKEFSNKYSEKLFWETIEDINLKAKACKSYKGVWGIFTNKWYIKFFECKIVRLGRLQYEETIANNFINKEITFGGYKINSNDKIYSVHIPELGPLLKKDVEDSYKLASEFFSERPIVLFCDSWLLYEDNKRIIKGKSNIKQFIEGWFILQNIKDEKFEFCWRIFNEDYKGNTKLLIKKTELQKNIVEWLNLGYFVGKGIGIKIL